MIMIIFKVRRVLSFFVLLFLGTLAFTSCDKIGYKHKPKPKEIGDKLDSLNGVFVYYNSSVKNVSGRNMTADGYNLGLKYQCVEFVKRYYYEHLDHKMPNSYGHAKDFFVKGLADGKMMKHRNLIQYTNPSSSKPKGNDLLVFDGHTFNKFGHVAIISKVTENKIEIIQQNPGAYSKSRENFTLENKKEKWKIQNKRVLGWLRKK
ncbi:CHAP domain-containing protein [Mesonia sp. MT50]|uniref:CHAP domain-containing protein n=1 Tax=Mesonia profundi TaxID=3070998 RepID=A0ABU1A110_9FLAO|nr:CHAP domain-containing protein [Mesonia profundi]MDQ7917393.1 CHAP domain-containing protein [Mesonia profundi]